MTDSEMFDALYERSRNRLLGQAYLLTGDLPAALGAVRDAFTAAWQRWPKTGRAADIEAVVRPRVWTLAQRRHTARLWHRERAGDPEVAATLEGLGVLDATARRLLLLDAVIGLSETDAAAEVGLGLERASIERSEAYAAFVTARQIPPTEVSEALRAVADSVATTRWPDAAALRRAGGRRRQVHTAAGVLVTIVALVLTGLLVNDRDGTPAALDRAPGLGEPSGAASSAETDASPDGTTTTEAEETARLLTPDEVAALAPSRTWRSRTSYNTAGDGLVLPCQQQRYADPDGAGATVRVFSSQGAASGPAIRAYQMTEVSNSAREADTAYRTWLGWTGGCDEPRAHLLDTFEVDDLGDAATLMVLAQPGEEGPGSVVVGTARSGRFTTTVARASASGDTDDDTRRRVTGLLGEAVGHLCGATGSGACSGEPRATRAGVVPVGERPQMLAEVDLPPVGGVTEPWVGTQPAWARTNDASTVCDATDFRGDGVQEAITRTFLAPGADVADEFGLTETTGLLGSPAPAARFVEGIASSVDGCEDENPGVSVETLLSEDDASAWVLTVDLSETRSIRYLMGTARSGARVAQVGFVPSGSRTIGDDAFVALIERARQRLASADQ